MKKYPSLIFLALFILIPVLGNTQSQGIKASYNIKKDILYRESANLDEYMSERCFLDIYYPVDKTGYSTVVWFHGGGLRAGEKSIPSTLTEQGFAVVAVNYRLFPRAKCPDYIDDAAAAVAWVFKHIHEYAGDPEKIVVSGHSAGGYLSSMIGLDKSYLQKYGIDADAIAAIIPFSGHTITHFTIREERGIEGTKVVVDEFAPISHLRKDAPPLVLITGDREKEMLGRYEENAYMYRMMKLVGHENTLLYELDGFDHGGMADPAFYILIDYIHDLE